MTEISVAMQAVIEQLTEDVGALTTALENATTENERLEALVIEQGKQIAHLKSGNKQTVYPWKEEGTQ